MVEQGQSLDMARNPREARSYPNIGLQGTPSGAASCQQALPPDDSSPYN